MDINDLLVDEEVEIKLLRLQLDGEWNIHLFSEFMESIAFIYDFINLCQPEEKDVLIGLFKSNRPTPFQRRDIFNSVCSVEDSSGLILKRIQISSPGFADFIGVGKVMAELRELLKDLCYRNRYEKRAMRANTRVAELEAERLELRNKIIKKLSKRVIEQLGYNDINISEADLTLRLILEQPIHSIESAGFEGKFISSQEKVKE